MRRRRSCSGTGSFHQFVTGKLYICSRVMLYICLFDLLMDLCADAVESIYAYDHMSIHMHIYVYIDTNICVLMRVSKYEQLRIIKESYH